MSDKKVPDNQRRSALFKQGPLRAAQRSLLRGMGLDDDTIYQPFVGVVSTQGEMSPCNIKLKDQVEQAKLGIYGSGGTPREFNTISVSDGLVNGHSGMHYSLISREVIADSVEVVVRAHQYDALFCIGACDKNFPAMMMAMVRLNVPAIFLNGGTTIPGTHKGERVEIKTIAEALGRYVKQEVSVEELDALSQDAWPAPGCCPGQFTANTMGMVAEVLGLAMLGSAAIPAVYSQRLAVARQSGKLLMDALNNNGPLPRELVTRKSLENACAAVAATGGSTNAALHIPAIANEAGIDFDIDDIARVFARTPLIANLSPSGPYLIKDLYDIGGYPVVFKELLRGGFLHGDCLTISGETLDEALRDTPAADGNVVLSVDTPRSTSGGLVVLKGNLCPQGALIKSAGLDATYHKGIAKVFTSEEDCIKAVLAREIKSGMTIIIRGEGPKGGPGMRELVTVTALLYGMGMGENVTLITDGRFSGVSRGFCIGYVSPEFAAGGPIGLVRDGDTIEVDLKQAEVNLRITDEQWQQRVEEQAQQPIEPNLIATTGVAGKYVNTVGPASQGAITHKGGKPWPFEDGVL